MDIRCSIADRVSFYPRSWADLPYATATSWTSCVAELDKVGPWLMHIPSCMPAHQVVVQGAEDDELLTPPFPSHHPSSPSLYFKNSESNVVGWIVLHTPNSNLEIGP